LPQTIAAHAQFSATTLNKKRRPVKERPLLILLSAYLVMVIDMLPFDAA
jgi:hypothetical protein